MKFILSLLSFVFLNLNSHYLKAQWTIVATPTTRIIWNIAFADENTVYAVGDSVLIKSSDGGHNWIDLLPNLAPLATSDKYYNLRFLNKDTGFIFKNDATKNLLRTEDGGLSWSDVSTGGMPYGILDMHFVNQFVGYAAGGSMDSNMARTTDGGVTWNHIAAAAIYVPAAVHFITDSIGFCGYEAIYKTTDAGSNWTLTNTPLGWTSNNRVTEYSFFNNQTGFALTEQWDLYKTTNGGNDWELVNIPVTPGGFCRGLDFDQNQFGYVMGYIVHQPFVSTDGGDTWVLDASYPSYYPSMCISISEGHKVIIGTSTGHVVLKEHYPLSASNVKSLNEISVYPNPSTGKFYINSSVPIKSIEVYNCLGSLMSRTIPGINIHVYETDLSHLAKGLYIVRISGETNSIQRKLILQLN